MKTTETVIEDDGFLKTWYKYFQDYSNKTYVIGMYASSD